MRTLLAGRARTPSPHLRSEVVVNHHLFNDAASGMVPQHLFEKSGVELSPKTLTRFPFSIWIWGRGRWAGWGYNLLFDRHASPGTSHRILMSFGRYAVVGNVESAYCSVEGSSIAYLDAVHIRPSIISECPKHHNFSSRPKTVVESFEPSAH